MEQTEEMFGTIDILINSAGVMYYTMMKNMHVEEWERQIDVNCKVRKERCWYGSLPNGHLTSF